MFGVAVSDLDPSNAEPGYVRLYVGLEKSDYLIKNLDQSFKKLS